MLPRETPDDISHDFPAIPTTYYFADYVLSTEKASSDTIAFVNIIQQVRQDIDEATRLCLSTTVSNFLDAYLSKRTWIEDSLLEVHRALNEIGMDMDIAWGHDGDDGTIALKRKLEWGLKNQKKLLKRKQQLDQCHAQLTGAIHVMSTAELCWKLGDIAQEPIFEAPVRPWVPQDQRDALRGPLSQFSASERSQWNEGRETKYEDDKAYLQQGNLNVDLVSMYGEGTTDGTFESYTATIRQKELDTQDQENWNKNLNASDEDSDRTSVISQTDSIWSVASLDSTATGFSAASGYSPAQIETATKELLRIFLEHDNLASLYKIAMERAHIGPERLQRNVRRLLRAFAQDLQANADSELEKLAARLVSFKSAFVARSVIEKYEVKSLRTFAANLQPLHVSQKDDESSDEEEEEEKEEDIRDHVDEDLIEDLSAFRQFLAEGVAFAHFQRQLETFVRSRCVEAKGGGGEMEHSSRMLLSKSQMALESLFIAAGFLEPPIDPGMVRIRWRCVSQHEKWTRD
jgi:hypothetical protein